MNKGIYLVGAFGGENDYRNHFIGSLPHLNWVDPRKHPQSSISKLNQADMNAAAENACLAYVSNGKLGTMSYCELGAARAAGQPIIVVDESEQKNSFLKEISSYYFNSTEHALDFLFLEPKLESKLFPLEENDVTSTKNPCKLVALSGIEKNNPFFVNDKEFYEKSSLIDKTDLYVINFNRGEKHNPETLFNMGIAYHTNIPILLLEGNDAPYPPLLGLARRVLVGENRFNNAKNYLKNLKSQHIEDEALIYYNLMNKVNR